jgi:hypothetical protein
MQIEVSAAATSGTPRSALHHQTLKRLELTLPTRTHPSAASIEYAIYYDARRATFWDNNRGMNYSIRF